uniref:Uncharacterized protein n=1 Tax=Rhizophora mucronata TaxID=61149 RepID=A0A2P2Q0A5_RHIMU
MDFPSCFLQIFYPCN